MPDKFNVALLSNDIDLHTLLTNTGFFNDVRIEDDISNIKDAQILIVSDRVVNYNRFVEFLSYNQIAYNNIFYLLSRESNFKINTLKSVLQPKGVTVIQPNLTLNQIVERISAASGHEGVTDKNIAVFFGADSKVGNTMTAQAVAECLASHISGSVILLFLNGNTSDDYISELENTPGIDSIKAKIVNDLLTPGELNHACYKNDNLHVLKGPETIIGTRHYHPEHIESLVHIASENHSAVIIDAGCKLSMGMAIGALNSTYNRYLVTSQQDNSKRNFNKTVNQLFYRLGFELDDFMLVVNKYIRSSEIYTSSQLADMYGIKLIGEIPRSEYSWQAEKDKSSLMPYETSYTEAIEEITKSIAIQLSLDFVEVEKKKTSFLQKIMNRRGA